MRQTNRGRSLIPCHYFDYCFERDDRIEEGFEYWRCPRRPPYWPGRATVQSAWQIDPDGNRFKMGRVTAPHNHPPIFGQHNDKREERQTKLERARQAKSAKKTAPQPNTNAETPQQDEAGPSTSAAPTEEAMEPPPPTPGPVPTPDMDEEIFEFDDLPPSTSATPIGDLLPFPTTPTAPMDTGETTPPPLAIDERSERIEQLEEQDRMRVFLSKKPKAHLLLFHFVPFARQHQFIGLLDEQGDEALHSVWRRLEQWWKCMPDAEQILQQFGPPFRQQLAAGHWED
ncbi:hypothetical protein niasHT_032176 [Heterodera trifolii]|uniref:FLYWCH-type domain-containing protein n=1 Tax=Heterodera trifolii TaxID=157864 RepID=A0ABD2HU38_9BILA